MINIKKLNEELLSAGIDTVGCNGKGIVWADEWDGERWNEIQDRKDVKAVIEAHDPTPEPEETLDEKIENLVDKKLKEKK